MERSPAEELSPEQLLDAALAELRQRWRQDKPVQAAELLRRHPVLAADEERAAALVYQEFLLREQTGAGPAFEDMLGQYPRFAAAVRRLYEADCLAGGRLPMPVESTTGQQVGSYVLLEEIGRGGMGVVYKAWQRRLGG